jgi:hypothetical protein
MREHPRQHYEQVAEVYDEAVEEGDPPTQSVAEAFAVPYTTAARWVRRARALALLPEPTPGLPRGNASSPISTRPLGVEIPVDNPQALND